MSLKKGKRQEIINELINEIGKDIFYNSFSVDSFADLCGLTKQSVYRYLETLEKEAKITKQKNGRDNIYRLVDTQHKFNFSLTDNLSEDVIWKRDIKPILGDMTDAALRTCYYTFSEMLNNAIDHSEGTEVIVIVNINAFSVSFQIIDDGIGIFTKISSALELEEKRFALLELVKGKFTTVPDGHSGEGIFFSAKAADIFGIFADDLVFSSLSFLEEEHDRLLSYKLTRPKGTVVFIVVFRESNRPLSEIFDQYITDPDEYGFTKTILPVRMLEYGDSNPAFISRSQAKRLLARFERFELIELDFSGVDEIGQGFADEVFRVFRNQHPGSVITPVNCSLQVKRMINRATGTINNTGR